MVVWYMNGAGNDFAVVDARNISIDMSNMAKILCEKGKCDGFMALDNSSIADIRLHFYNRDGSRADMCGNGARCICRFAYDNGIVEKEMTVETDAGVVEGQRIAQSIYKIKLNTPKNITLGMDEEIDYAVVGVPHIAIECENLDFSNKDRLLKRARELRDRFDANVNFYSKIDDFAVKILTYERGVEDFTLACGTGSGAVAAILFSKCALKNRTLSLQNQGGELRVEVDGRGQKINALYLEGGAEVDEVITV